MTEEENQQAFDHCMEFINKRKPPKVVEWWRVEYTSWSNGQSWFEVIDHLTSQEAAIEHIKRSRWGDPAIKWRYVHVTLEREDNKSVATEIWTEV